MAQSSVAITAGSGTAIDAFKTSGTQNYRQSVVVADPTTDAAAAAVENTDPGSSDYGLVVRDRHTPNIDTNVTTLAGAVSSSKVQTNLAQVGGSAVALGNTTTSASIPVTMASNQASISVTQKPATSGGLTPYKLISANTTNGTNVKNGAGNLHHANAQNNTGTIYYLKLYDKATTPTVGTDTPKHTYLIPANTNGAGVVVPLPDIGVSFANGIGIAITGGIGDSDTTACASNAVVVNLDYN